MTPRRRLALAAATLVLAVVAGVLAVYLGVRSELPAGDRAALSRILSGQLGLIVLLGLFVAFGLSLLVALFFARYVTPVRRLAREARRIAEANPDHRLTSHGPAEQRELASAVNAVADRAQAAQEDVRSQIAAARAGIERERNTLAALMSELTLAVLVCNRDGRILLYNEAAGRLFGGDGSGAGLLGLGRSVFGIVDRSLVAHALERLGDAAGDGAPPVHLTATTPAGRLLRAGVAPVQGDGEVAGFVLTLEDVTRAAEAGGRRDALLQSLTQGTRAAVGTIRAAIESLLDYPDMVPAERERFLSVIEEEAVRLSGQVDAALRESADQLRAEWSLAETLGRDLVAAARRTLVRELGVTATSEDAGEELWLEVDSFSLVRAVAHLAARLREQADAEAFSLALEASGRSVRLDLGWEGRPLDEETLRAWTREPLRADGGGLTLQEVLERHGAEAWAENEVGGRSRVRLALPVAAPAPGARALRPPSAPAARVSPAETRPEFYDFDLFAADEETREWDERRLAEVAYTVFDCEMTGLSPSEGDEIVAIGAARILNGRLLRRETLDLLIDPQRPIPPAAVAVHGISPAMVRGQPTIEAALPAFARFAAETVLVGHNVAFDLRFLELKEERTGVRFHQPVLDTLLLSAVVHPDEEDHSLEAMAARLGVSIVGRHTALGDALVTGEIFLRQLRMLAGQGITTLGEAREAARRTYAARKSESLYSRA